jgi:HAD superfamily hydrolase (TIGR01509 family)
MIRAALFDLDGTLVDTEPQTEAAICAIVSKYGHPQIHLPSSETCGRSWRHIAQKLLSMISLPVSQGTLEEELLHTWNELVSVRVAPLPGVIEALQEAKAAGLLLGVVSSSPRSVIDTLLETIGASPYMERSARIGADNVTHYKPAPEGFLLAAKSLGVEPSECIVFEDSSSGLKAARAAKMLSISVLYVSRERELCRSLSDASILHYQALPKNFFFDLAQSKERTLGALSP